MYNPGDILYIESKNTDFKCIIILALLTEVIYAHVYMPSSNHYISFDFHTPTAIIFTKNAFSRYATDEEKRKLNELMVRNKIYFDKKHLALVQNNEI